ncbi:MAG: flagellar basal body rod protein FlgB [Nevskiaceae bacterium]
MFDLDAHFKLHAESLKLSSRRSEMIARNLANAETPNYKASDLDFRKALTSVLGEEGADVGMTATSAGHLAGSRTVNADNHLINCSPLVESLDGNTVDVQAEQAAFAETSIRYQASLNFVNSQLRGLMTAITGQ